ncbi:methionine ABC transporter ATP-binding protein [Pengzhenrongella frigida]|uniref:Methionine ABC transporter ATP-binding protein n=1 Tax=Pengzhenrongella frigida TaxID=1259133 RepID=A0A4Q5MXX7_9MICO|nr:methionine ABC transporter ATP-binding protein [Cellulomonas sp. HLT2-17]RYV50612.1 methionine ABC transporter ATP-binding protein [Cellulomonas sp. HLT2-17]
MSAMVCLQHVTKEFTAGKQTVRAVDDVSLEIERGEIFGVIGYSGAGKSTLVRLINALESPTSGTVVIDGETITGRTERQLRPVRARIGFIFQQFNLLGSRTVAGNVAYPLRVARWPKERREARVAELLEFVGLSDKARQYPDQLSGGQKQRVGIARALATSPGLLLADEATSALDPETTRDVLDLLRRVNTELGVTIVVISHEMSVVSYLCDRVAVMEAGKVVEEGDVYTIFSSPQQPVTRRFIATALHDRPGPDVVQRLRERHRGRIVTFGVRDGHGSGTFLSEQFRAHRVDGSIVYGGITDIGAKPLGSLTFELVGTEVDVDALLVTMREHTDVVEYGGPLTPTDTTVDEATADAATDDDARVEVAR